MDQSVENVWPDKVDYSLSTPTKAVIFGTSVQVDFKLIPLLKGLKFGKVTTELQEKQEFTIQGRAPKRKRDVTRTIAKDEYRHPDAAETMDIEGQEGFLFSRIIPLPQSLKNCMQTVEAMGIKIRHNLIFNVQMLNPDRHVSEVRGSEPTWFWSLLKEISFMLVSLCAFSFLRTCPSMTIITWSTGAHGASMPPQPWTSLLLHSMASISSINFIVTSIQVAI